MPYKKRNNTEWFSNHTKYWSLKPQTMIRKEEPGLVYSETRKKRRNMKDDSMRTQAQSQLEEQDLGGKQNSVRVSVSYVS
jgi:hypothetical protein